MSKLQMTGLINLLCISLLFTVLSGCGIDRDKAVDREKFTFGTGDDTELFFKNVRQSSYDLEENEAAGLRVFRHRDMPESDSTPYIIPAIVMNVLRDEAYILPEPSPVLADEDVLSVILGSGTAADTIELALPNRENNLEFASRIYEHLQQSGTFMIRSGDLYVPFLEDEDYREAFRVTMSDYYRLTRIY